MAVPSGMTRFTAGALAACGAFAAVEVLRAAGVAVHGRAFVLLGSTAAVVAATAAARNVAHVWRGPLIVDFQRGDGLLCDARESVAVRAAAQLRGTMGGAGYLHPCRLAFSASAWAAAAVQAVVLVSPDRGSWEYLPAAVGLVAVAFAGRFPATPFYYRETAGDCVVVFPAEAASRLLAGARLSPTPSPMALAAGTGEPGEATAGTPDGESKKTRRGQPSA
ncbi:MAG TPA: hypothetical protein VF841_01080 [Anaeromyxobacter sp.]